MQLTSYGGYDKEQVQDAVNRLCNYKEPFRNGVYLGGPFLVSAVVENDMILTQTKPKEYYEEKKRILREAMYRGDNPDGTWGADMRTLCNEHYNYIGDGKYCTHWLMIRYNDGLDKDGHVVDPDDFKTVSAIESFYISNGEQELADRPEKICHVLASKSVLDKPKTKGRGRSLKIDPDDARLDIYCYDQVIWKRQEYKPPKVYHNLSDDEKRSCRTKKTRYKNDYKRSEIYGEMKVEKICWYCGKELPASVKAEYQARIDATRIDDEANPMVGHIGYKASDALAVTAIVIDMDNHDLPSDQVQDACHSFARLLAKGCDENGEIIAKVLSARIVETGRGLQLWFPIEPVYVGAFSMVRQTTKALCDEYKEILKKYCPILEVDRIASLNILGPKRQPGSRNSHALSEKRDGTYGFRVRQIKSRVVSQEPVDIRTIMHTLGVPVYSEIKAERAEKKEKTAARKFGFKGHNIRAEKLIQFLKSCAKGMGQGCRNQLLFFAGTLAVENHSDPYIVLREINSLFSEPLTDTEVDKTAKSASKGIYHYTTEDIVKGVGRTEDDIKTYGITFGKCGSWVSNEDRAKTRQKKRDRRDADIMSHIRAGESISAAAKAVGVCRTTVKKVINEAEERKRRTELHRQLISARKQKSRDSFSAIMKKVKVAASVIRDDTRSRAAVMPITNLTS